MTVDYGPTKGQFGAEVRDRVVAQRPPLDTVCAFAELYDRQAVIADRMAKAHESEMACIRSRYEAAMAQLATDDNLELARACQRCGDFPADVDDVGLCTSCTTRSCRVCGCTDDLACDGGCSWADDDLCTACAHVTAGVPA